MRNIFITTTAVIFFTMLCSCTTSRTSQKAGTPDQLNKMENSIWRKGYMLAKTECAECHRFYSPKEYSPEKWDIIIKDKAKRVSLTKDQVDALDLYFQSESSTSQ